MHTETKAMICTSAVLIAIGIFKELAAVCLITAVVFDERIAIQNRNIERVIQVSNNQVELALLEREIATYLSVKKLIKEKCTP